MRVLKWLIGLMLLMITVVILIAAYFALTFDANSYKDRIIKTIKTETGRDLTLNGDLNATFYPWLGIDIKDAGLSNAEGFSAEQFLKFEQASIRLQLLPLIKKNIVADRIQLRGLELWLQNNQQGKTNWDDLSERFASDSANPDQAESSLTGTIAGLSLLNAKIHWQDEIEKTELDLQITSFNTGELKPDTETKIDAEFSFSQSAPVIQGQVKVSGLTRLSQFDPFVLRKPELSLDLQGIDVQAENIHAVIDTPEIKYQDGNISLKQPSINYEIRNMPSLGKKSAGSFSSTDLTYANGNVIAPDAKINVVINGSAIIGEVIQAKVNAKELAYQDGSINMLVPAVEYNISKIADVGERATGSLTASKLSYKDDHIVVPNALLDVVLTGSQILGNDISAKIKSSELSYLGGKIKFKQADINYKILKLPDIGEQATGTLKSSELIYDDGSVFIIKSTITTLLTGSELPGDSLQASLESEQLSLVKNVMGLKNFSADTTFKGDPWPQKEMQSKVNGLSLSYDMEKDSISLPDFSATALGLAIKGSVDGSQVTKDARQLKGRISIADFSPKKIAPKLGIDLPEMSADAWTQANLSGNYLVTNNSVSMTNLKTSIDGTEWSGKASLDDLEKKKISFDLAAASLDANRLMPPKQATALKDKEGKAASEAAVNAIKVPQEPLQAWDAKGTLKLGTLIVGNVVTTNLEAGIDLLDGKLRIFPSKANFFGGQYSGDIKLDVSGTTPRLQADETVTNLDMAAMGNALWESSYMTGRANAHAKIDAKGNTVGMLRKNATGALDFKVVDGVLLGFDLNYAVANAVSIFRSKSFTDVANTKKTEFQSLSATAKMNNGVLQNDDFLAVMPRMRIRGNGSINLNDTSLNYHVDADVLESKSASNTAVQTNLDELVGATIPVKVTGTLAEPKISPDVSGYLKGRVEKEIRDRAKKEIDDRLKDKLGGSVGGVLGDLLGGKKEPTTTTPPPVNTAPASTAPTDPNAVPENKPAEEPVKPEEKVDPVQQKKDELEKKAKDKLKDLFGG